MEEELNIFLTGAFGNVGTYTLKNLMEMGHHIKVLELENKRNKKIYNDIKRKYRRKDFQIIWGDITDYDTVRDAVEETDIIIHQAFIIPPLSEVKPNWAWEINVEGTRNLLKAARESDLKPGIVFTSSVSVFGKTQDLAPPRDVMENVQPTDNYSHHKVACEQLVKVSGLNWTILRLGAVLAPSLCEIDPLLFSVPLDNRIELVHAADAGYAIATAAVSNDLWGSTYLIGGGKCCQMLQKEFIGRVLKEIGIGMLPEEAFTSKPFYTDWMDTSRSQELLDYQKRDLDDFLEDIRKSMGIRRHLVKMVKPAVKYWLLRKSPYIANKANEEKIPGKILKGKPATAT
jgi:nucleoside-diphosphate-sugar epimerase